MPPRVQGDRDNVIVTGTAQKPFVVRMFTHRQHLTDGNMRSYEGHEQFFPVPPA
jgi:hypothetical protein